MKMRRLFFIACLLIVAPAYAQGQAQVPAQVPAPEAPKAVPQSVAQIQMSFAPVVKKVTPGVVNIYAKQKVEQVLNPLFADPLFQQFFGGMGLQMQPRVANSLGSGVIVRDSGLVVTNAHVAANATEIRVALSDRREFSAKPVLVDEKSDLAVLQLDLKGQKLPALPLADSDKAEVGDLVLAIGNPFGVGQTVTSGIVSATARTNIGSKGYGYYIQTDAAINPGNSGGALVNMAGEVVGINTMIVSKSGGYMGIGFATPANLVKQVVAAAESGGKTIQRAWLGASLQPVTTDVADSVGLDRPRGALVQNVYEKGPAAEAGVTRGDILLSIDGIDIEDMNGVRYALATRALGSVVPVTVWRDGKEAPLQFKVTMPKETAKEAVKLTGDNPLSGAEVSDITPETLEEMGGAITADKGVVVKQAGRIAARLGFRPGDIIMQVNGEKVTRATQLQSLLSKRSRGWAIAFGRGDQVLTLRIN